MPLVEADIHTILSGASAVTDIVGTKIQPIPGKKQPKPFLTYQRISTVPLVGLEGTQNFATYRVQINCWGRNALESKQLGEAVRQALDAETNIVFDNELDLFDEEAGPYAILDFLIYRQID